jgi:hypothetical protein
MEVSLVENEHVTQALASDGTDEPLRERILPWAGRRREDLLDPHALRAVSELWTVDLVTIAQEKGRRGLVRKRRPRFAGRSSGRWGAR